MERKRENVRLLRNNPELFSRLMESVNQLVCGSLEKGESLSNKDLIEKFEDSYPEIINALKIRGIRPSRKFIGRIRQSVAQEYGRRSGS